MSDLSKEKNTEDESKIPTQEKGDTPEPVSRTTDLSTTDGRLPESKEKAMNPNDEATLKKSDASGAASMTDVPVMGASFDDNDQVDAHTPPAYLIDDEAKKKEPQAMKKARRDKDKIGKKPKDSTAEYVHQLDDDDPRKAEQQAGDKANEIPDDMEIEDDDKDDNQNDKDDSGKESKS